MKSLKEVVNPGVVNAIHHDLPTLASFTHFPAVQFCHCRNVVLDIKDKSEQLEIITSSEPQRIMLNKSFLTTIFLKWAA